MASTVETTDQMCACVRLWRPFSDSFDGEGHWVNVMVPWPVGAQATVAELMDGLAERVKAGVARSEWADAKFDRIEIEWVPLHQIVAA